MNHDVFRNVIYSALLSVYKNLYDEYKNEEIAKKQTLKLTNEILVGFGMKGDLFKVYETLTHQYKQSNDEQRKFELYRRIEILSKAIDIVKEENLVGNK